MALEIIKISELGFCSGVRRAIAILEKEAPRRGRIDALGALVHNEQVMRRLSEKGIHVIENLEEITGNAVAISAHGVSPQVEAELRSKEIDVIDTTCPDVKKAQKAAQILAEEGYFVIVFGDSNHPEVKGILGRAIGKSMATQESAHLTSLKTIPRKLGILSQTTQTPENFFRFLKDVIDQVLVEGMEIRVINSICHGVRRRQSETMELAQKVDLMLIIGSKTSANSQRLLEICSNITEAYLILNPADIKTEWLDRKTRVGITSGTSTSQESINEVIYYLEDLTGKNKS